MTPTWQSHELPPAPRAGVLGAVLFVLRGVALGLVLVTGLALMLILRLVERPIFGLRRPWTPWITQVVCKVAFLILQIPVSVSGRPLSGQGAVVSNHVSWLDIFTLNSRKRVYFVSKSEVASWPLIGWLARATGTVFIERKKTAAADQARVFENRIRAGHRLLFFPEGTSTDGIRVLPFKPTLFEAFFRDNMPDDLKVQPVTLIYSAPRGTDPRFYGWWGDMSFGTHLRQILSAPRQGRIEIVYHSPLSVSDFPDRKALAKACEDVVRGPIGIAQ